MYRYIYDFSGQNGWCLVCGLTKPKCRDGKNKTIRDKYPWARTINKIVSSGENWKL